MSAADDLQAPYAPAQRQHPSANRTAVAPEYVSQHLQHGVYHQCTYKTAGARAQQQCGHRCWPGAAHQECQHGGTSTVVTPASTSAALCYQQQQMPATVQHALQQHFEQPATAIGPSPLTSTLSGQPSPCSRSNQQQQQPSPGSLRTAAQTVGAQSGQPVLIKTAKSACGTSEDLLGSIVVSLETEVTKVIRPIISQVIQQKLLQEVQSQIAQLSGATLQQHVMQQVQQQMQKLVFGCLQQQQQQQHAQVQASMVGSRHLAAAAVPPTPTGYEVAAAAAAGSLLQPGYMRAGGSSPDKTISGQLLPSRNIDTSAVVGALPTSCDSLPHQQQQQQPAVLLASYPSCVSNDSVILTAGVMQPEQQQQQQQHRMEAPSPDSSNVSSWSAQRGSPTAAVDDNTQQHYDEQQQQQQDVVAAAAAGDGVAHPSLSLSLGSLPALSADIPGMSFGCSTPVTVRSNDTKATPFSAFIQQQADPQATEAPQQQQPPGAAEYLQVPLPQVAAPAAVAAAEVGPAAAAEMQGYTIQSQPHHQQQQQQQQALQVTPQTALAGRRDQQTPTSSAAAAAAGITGDSTGQCTVIAAAMRALLADTELPDLSMVAAFGGTSGNPGPIPGNIFDDVDALGDFLAGDDDFEALGLLAAPVAAVPAAASVTPQQHKQQHARLPVGAAPAAASTGTGYPLSPGNPSRHSNTTAASVRTVGSTAAAAAGSAGATGTAAATAGAKRKRGRLPGSGTKQSSTPSKKQNNSKNSSQVCGRSDTSAAQKQQAQVQKQVHRQTQMPMRWQQQQDQHCQDSGLMSQLPAWLTRHVAA